MHGQPVVMKAILEGECNQCGLCCTFMYNGERVYCENLDYSEKFLGNPMATFCRVHAQRTPDMPIRMLNNQHEFVVHATCAMNNEAEAWAIINQGIGRGCALTMRLVGN